jgi:hypothetical protein
MRRLVVGAGFCSLVALAPAIAGAQGNHCTFPGKGIGVGGTPAQSPGTFPGGGATGGAFPGGNCGNGGTVSASEPLTVGLTAVALLGAAMLRRRRKTTP